MREKEEEMEEDVKNRVEDGACGSSGITNMIISSLGLFVA